MCRPRCVHLSRIQQENRARRENVGRSPAVKTHRSPFNHSYRWNGMKVMCKFILPIRTLKKFGAAQSAMPPDTGALILTDGPGTMLPEDMGVLIVSDSR